MLSFNYIWQDFFTVFLRDLVSLDRFDWLLGLFSFTYLKILPCSLLLYEISLSVISFNVYLRNQRETISFNSATLLLFSTISFFGIM